MSLLLALYLALLQTCCTEHGNQTAPYYSSHLIDTSVRTSVVSILIKDSMTTMSVPITSTVDVSLWLSTSVHSLITCLYWLLIGAGYQVS